MSDWLAEIWRSVTWGQLLTGLGLFVGSMVISLVAVAIVLIKLPATYFHSSHVRTAFDNSWKGWTLWLGKNALGVVLVGLGILTSVPGIPGQGILTILLGIMLLDFPGRRRFELFLLRRPKVHQGINRLRRRFGKPPLVLDEDDEAGQPLQKPTTEARSGEHPSRPVEEKAR
jgi:hypothetical protein